ncbi:hypothetical protein JOC77_001520 [Peribacillus deserti]|uniref:Uncharacterized protein n=1 Tax=Peribacillus deserti TaxID=673318 RepID=A0ABS2QHV7_9BACI|nr:hypothetical protein [Peribacillus deserti]MBM7692093.1 hypothetical protein [Peribacillus deserti]
MKKLSAVVSSIVLASTLLLPAAAGAHTSKDDHLRYPNSKKLKNIILNKMISKLSDEEKIGQLVMPSTHDDSNSMPNEQTRELIQKYKAGSVIVYGERNARKTAGYNNQL